MTNPVNLFSLHNIKILNWNSDGIRTKKSLLKDFLSRHKIDIACLTETHLTERENFSMPGYSVYRFNRNSITASGGAAILIKRRIQHNEIYLPTLEKLKSLLSM